MKYKDEKGTVLYGFSQENLSKTNREIRRTNNLLLVLIILFIIFLLVLVFSFLWVDYNNIITRFIYS